MGKGQKEEQDFEGGSARKLTDWEEKKGSRGKLYLVAVV